MSSLFEENNIGVTPSVTAADNTNVTPLDFNYSPGSVLGTHNALK